MWLSPPFGGGARSLTVLHPVLVGVVVLYAGDEVRKYAVVGGGYAQPLAVAGDGAVQDVYLDDEVTIA